MTKSVHLSRRERQIMDIVYELDEVSAKDVLDRLPNPPGYSAVRAMLNKLEKKGHLKHRERDLKYIYFPTMDPSEASRNAVSRLLKTFFDGSVTQAMSALIDHSDSKLSTGELEKLESLIEQAKKDKQEKNQKP